MITENISRPIFSKNLSDCSLFLILLMTSENNASWQNNCYTMVRSINYCIGFILINSSLYDHLCKSFFIKPTEKASILKFFNSFNMPNSPQLIGLFVKKSITKRFNYRSIYSFMHLHMGQNIFKCVHDHSPVLDCWKRKNSKYIFPYSSVFPLLTVVFML